MNLELLFSLQELEKKETEIQKSMKKLPQYKELKMMKEKFELNKKKLEERNASLQKISKKLKTVEQNAAVLESKEKELVRILYDGSSNNPKELESMQEKIEIVKGKKDLINDEIINRMSEKEELEDEIKKMTEDLKDLYKDFNRVKGQYQRIKINLDQDLRAVQEDKEALIARIDKKWLVWFEEKREKYLGTPIGKITESHFCSGCRTMIPAMIVREARQRPGEVYCERCGRVLFAPKIS